MAKKKSTSAGSGQGGREAAPPKPYVVLARKYRPQTFDDLVGQEAMVQTLRNAFAAGRIAHGYMLTGVRGVGKTTTARLLARAMNYETDAISKPSIDMAVPGRHCAEIMESRHPDVIEMDAASNTGVDNIREIIESARYKPLLARTKVFIVDEVHMLSKGAFNALLKTLEEPPEHVKFIFATTEIRKVPVTVLSRCQRFDLRRVDVPRLRQHLKEIVAKEGGKAEDDALTLIARAAEGSVRDALSILDQAIALGSGVVSAETVRAMLGLADRGRVFDLMEHLVRGNAASALTVLGAIHRDGADAIQVLADLAEAVHIAARIKAVGPEAAGEGLSAEEKRRAGALGERLSTALLARAWQMLLKGLEESAKAPDPLAAAEMVLIRIAYTADLPAPDEIIKALGGDGQSLRRAGTGPSGPARSEKAPSLNAAEAGTPSATPSVPEAGMLLAEMPADEPQQGSEAGIGDPHAATAPGAGGGAAVPELQSFADVVALVGEHRDAKLKMHLEEHVSLVKFDAAAGSIDLCLLSGAPAEIANELREKLNKWTGRRWVVLLSKHPGESPLGAARREREAAEIAALETHPAVAAVREAFPEARIAAVRRLKGARDDDSAAG